MDEKKRKDNAPTPDYDLTPPPYEMEWEADEDEEEPGKASTKTRVLPRPNRGSQPGDVPGRAEPPRFSRPGADPFDLSRPPLNPHEREEWEHEFERRAREGGEDDDDADEGRLPPADPGGEQPEPEERRPLPRWALVCGIGGGALFLIVSILLFVSPDSTYAVTVHGAPPGSTLYIDDTPGGVPDAQGRITAQGFTKGKFYKVRVAHPDYQEVVVDVHSENGSDQRVDVTLHKLATRAPQPAPQPSPANPTAQAAGSTEVDYGGQMVLVAAGEFTLGDDTHLPDEQPAHKVNVPAFYIDKYEVTNEQYKRFCDETRRDYPPSPWWDAQYMKTNPKGPVVGIGWEDAAAYAAWAGKRLPTEAEWEKAASWDPATGRKRLWPWGDTREQGRANLGRSKRAPKLVAVGRNSGGTSAYGVMDMAGNAAEWVDAFYEPYAGNARPNAGFGGKNRVVRGGACASSLDDARTTRRIYHAPEYSAEEKTRGTLLVGFRCALSADNPELQKRLQARAN